MPDPIDQIQWRDASELHANDYNPNKQAATETKLLEVSLLEDGWTQPIVVNEDDEIVDGFHRWTVAQRKAMMEKYGGKVPVVKLSGKTKSDRMMSTIRHNRARGTHHVEGMANIVQKLIEEGKTFDEIQHRLGMDYEEVERFAIKLGIPYTEVVEKHEFSKAWVPDR